TCMPATLRRREGPGVTRRCPLGWNLPRRHRAPKCPQALAWPDARGPDYRLPRSSTTRRRGTPGSRLAAVIGLGDESRAEQVDSADAPVGAGDREDMLLGKAAPPGCAAGGETDSPAHVQAPRRGTPPGRLCCVHRLRSIVIMTLVPLWLQSAHDHEFRTPRYPLPVL